ncbi:MAG: carbohydrate ABC transporter permease [Candidatus Lokiarchaeia archaeon]
MKEARYFSVFLFPTIAFFILFTIFPFLYAIGLSFTDFNLRSGKSLSFTGIGNYSKLLTDQLFQIALKNTIIVVIVATAFEVIIGIILATILYNYIGKLKKQIQTLLILPMAMAPVAIALMWKYMFNTTYGVINYIISSIGVQGIDWLGSNKWALISIIIVDIWQWTPLVFVIILAGFESIPLQTIEMGKVDGAGRLQLIRFFLFPQLRAFIVVAILLRMIDAFKLFDKVYVLTEGGPGSSTETLSLLGYRLGFQFFETGLAAAESIILLVIIASLTYFIMKTIRQIV